MQGKVGIIDSEQITVVYSNKKVDAVDKLLNELEQAALLSYGPDQYGFRNSLHDIDKIRGYKQAWVDQQHSPNNLIRGVDKWCNLYLILYN